ncbi:DUF4277 domain-containing protein [Nostoc sp. NZL]|nr:DUF4277 domain-containing protein [Nostoc sp. NZL]
MIFSFHPRLQSCLDVHSELLAFGIPHVVLLQSHILHLKLAYNKILGQHPQEKVSAGQAVKAMILNGLGFRIGNIIYVS